MKKRKQKTKNYQIRKLEKTKKISKNSHFLELIFPIINQYLFNLYCYMTEISFEIVFSGKCTFFCEKFKSCLQNFENH